MQECKTLGGILLGRRRPGSIKCVLAGASEAPKHMQRCVSTRELPATR